MGASSILSKFQTACSPQLYKFDKTASRNLIDIIVGVVAVVSTGPIAIVSTGLILIPRSAQMSAGGTQAVNHSVFM